MSKKRTTMRKIREILRLRLAADLSIRQIKASTKVSVGAIQKLLSRADTLGLTWPLPPEMDDNQLARLFYPGADTRVTARHQVPDWPAIHQELKRKGITKQLLWEEYSQHYPNRCYSYSQFCDRYSHWRGRSALLITVGQRFPSSVPPPVRSIRPRSSSPCWGLPTTPMPKPPAHSHYPTGWTVKGVCRPIFAYYTGRVRKPELRK